MKAEQWKLWNGYGPLEKDGLMRVERIGPEKGGLTGSEGRDIVGSKVHLELVCNSINALAMSDTTNHCCEKLARENEKLKVTLRKFAVNAHVTYHPGGDSRDFRDCPRPACKLAREALEGK